MRTPSWVELVGRNVAADAVSMSGCLRVTGSDRHGEPFDERFAFWHGGGGQWRIECDGQVVYIAQDEQSSLAFVDGQMRRQQRGRINMVWLGSMFSPLDLLGEESVLRQMSTGMRATNKVRSSHVGSRPVWLATLATPKGEGRVELAFDDTTGLLVWLRGPDGGGLLEVSGLVEHDQIEAERFDWDGPIVDSNRPDTRAAERIEIMSALSVALRRPYDLLKAIADSENPAQARSTLMAHLGITETGADAVLALQIRRFTDTEIRKIDRELSELRGPTSS